MIKVFVEADDPTIEMIADVAAGTCAKVRAIERRTQAVLARVGRSCLEALRAMQAQNAALSDLVGGLRAHRLIVTMGLGPAFLDPTERAALGIEQLGVVTDSAAIAALIDAQRRHAARFPGFIAAEAVNRSALAHTLGRLHALRLD